jgi:cardiolipin synthase
MNPTTIRAPEPPGETSRTVRPGGGRRICSGLGKALGVALLLPGCSSLVGEKDVKYQVEPRYAIADPQFEQAIGTLLGPSLVKGNHAVTLLNGAQIFPAMLEAIRSARRTITMETFLFSEGAVATAFARALAERARHGVKVHLILDAQAGGKEPGEENLRVMREAGVDLEIYRPLRLWKLKEYNHRTHRKLLVIDGKVGFTGGAGIDDRWRGHGNSPQSWRDTHFRVTGPIVAQMQAVFMDNWLKTRGHLLHGIDYFPPLAATGNYRAHIFPSSPTNGAINGYLMYLLTIASAQKSLLIETAYFVPDDLTLDALAKAAKRGVDVQIIVPTVEHTDTRIAAHGSRRMWGPLLENGVKIYEYQPGMLHTKALIADGLFCSVGSSNFDNRSFRLNDEANMNVMDRKFAAEQRRIFESDKANSRQITLAEWKARPGSHRLKEAAAGLIAPQL